MDNIYNDHLLIPFRKDEVDELFSEVGGAFSESQKIAIATKLFIEDSSAQITGRKGFVKQIYETRFLPLFGRAPNLELCPPRVSFDAKESLRMKMDEFSQELLERFSKIKSSGVKEINFANYIEDFSTWAVGLENVNYFLQCFE